MNTTLTDVNTTQTEFSELFESIGLEISDGEEEQIVLGEETEKWPTDLVAFHVKVFPTVENLAPWNTIPFLKIITNLGYGYDITTGEFTAPASGSYVFYLNIVSSANFESALLVNGIHKMLVYSSTSTPNDAGFASGSNKTVLELNTGDVVRVVRNGWWSQPPFDVQAWSTFTGVLTW